MKNNYFKMFTAEFENCVGEIIHEDIETDNLESATIEASIIAEKEGYEFLGIDYSNKNL